MEARALGGHFLFGHLLEFRAQRLALLRRVATECGELGMLRLGPFRMAVVNSARLAREVLVEREDEFSRIPLAGMDGIKRLYGQGILVADGEQHRAQRKRVTPALSRTQMSATSALVVDEVEAFARGLGDGAEVDLTRELSRLSRRLTRRVLFGITSEDETERELDAALSACASLTMSEVSRLVPWPSWVPTHHNRAFRKAIRTVDQHVARIVRERRDTGLGGEDVLSLLLRENERGLTDAELRDDLVNLFMAGSEAVTSAIFWSSYHLARDRKLQAALAEQARGALEGRPPAAADLARVPLATNAFREVLRLYPPGHLIGRVAKNDLFLGKAPLRRNTLVGVNAFMVQRSPEHFEQPESFDPSRFEHMTDHDLARVYLPFGAGPRTCLGNHFSMLAGPLSLLCLSQRVRCEPLDDGEVPPVTGLAIMPGAPFRVRVRRAESPRASPH